MGVCSGRREMAGGLQRDPLLEDSDNMEHEFGGQ